MDSRDTSNNDHTISRCKKRTLIRSTMKKGIDKRLDVRNILIATVCLSLFIALLNPDPHQQVAEGAKLKKEGKKLLKSLVKGLVVSKLSTRKNFMPLPVPIPVPIELSEPPVYLKGKPKYVNVYKATTPVVKPTTVYHMPVYSPTYQEYSTSMMDPMGLYGPMLGGGKAHGGSASMIKHSLTDDSALSGASFNDFDDDASNYYTRKSTSGGSSKRKTMALDQTFAYGANEFARRSDEFIQRSTSESSSKVVGRSTADSFKLIDEKESIEDDAERHKSKLRVKRQVYHQSSSYEEQEGPCYGFPLEVNVKSRIKLDRIFPIHGKSQYKKCIKVGRPLLPPVEEPHHPY